MNIADNKSTLPAAGLIAAATSQLLVVDIQQRLAPATDEPGDVIRHARILLNAAKTLGIPHTVSEQYPKGLGATVDDIAVLAEPARIFDKVHFSCQADDRLAAALAAQNRRHVIICGMEAHVCVLQTVLDLVAARYRVSVVADSCNTMELTRREWQAVAAANGALCSDIEVCCSDEAEHRRRVETRDGGSLGLYVPSWTEVQNRSYEPWQSDRIVVDTSGKTIDEGFDELMVLLSEKQSVD